MKKYEDAIREYLTERGWEDLRPGDLAKSISIESAELLEIFQWSNQTASEVRADTDKLELIKKELADVMLYCLDMSVVLGLDTGEIVLSKLEKVKQKYPAELFIDRDKSKDSGTEDIYWQIKKEYRAKGE